MASRLFGRFRISWLNSTASEGNDGSYFFFETNVVKNVNEGKYRIDKMQKGHLPMANVLFVRENYSFLLENDHLFSGREGTAGQCVVEHTGTTQLTPLHIDLMVTAGKISTDQFDHTSTGIVDGQTNGC